ncbi:MAG: Wzy polymerase domain-containing protein [Burkholderiales bacterium]|nr:Wzy polymerase domain-containing protein [Burkholderiales bacterium]
MQDTLGNSSSQQAHDAPAPKLLLTALAVSAVAVPALLAYNLPPSSTFLNQAAALVYWGAFLTVLTGSMRPAALRWSAGAAALQAAFAVLLLAALAAPLWAGAPWSLALSAAGLLGAAALTAAAGASAQRAGRGTLAFRALCIGLVVAGVATSLIGIVQVYVPTWADGNWIAPSGIPGRAVSNMRQPNHMSSLLLWAIVAAVWLGDTAGATHTARRVTRICALLMLFGLVLSGSRTGMLGTGLLALWGLIDRRLSRQARLGLVLAPVLFALFWWGAAAWSHHSHAVFGGDAQFNKSDISSSRFGIWANTLALIQAHPWFGVGFGEFNFAWTLTPFPGRPVAFFDHTHSLPLQLAVELGLPLAVLVLALLLWALWGNLQQALRAPAAGEPEAPGVHRAAFVIVLMVLLHSLLEYPLWYAYFLLPAAFAFGLGVERRAEAAAPEAPAERARTRPLLVASMLLMVGGLLSVADYLRVVKIFMPAETAPPLAERIADGQRSVFFAHHADYAAGTTAERPSEALGAFTRAPHYLLDARLMMAWAKALNQAGKVDEARFVAQRLKEFKNAQAAEFFKPCEEPAAADTAGLPFQCVAPTRAFRYEDFR